MFNRKKTSLDAAIDQLDRISKDSQSALAIIRAAKAEVIAEDGPNDEMNARELNARCTQDTPLRNARARLATLRIELQQVAEATALPELQRLEDEARTLHRENMDLVRSEIIEKTTPYLGEPLARKCANIAPPVLAEQEFQGRHVVSAWASSTRARFYHCHDFDGQDIAADIARHLRGVGPMVEAIREHSEQLRQRVSARAAA